MENNVGGKKALNNWCRGFQTDSQLSGTLSKNPSGVRAKRHRAERSFAHSRDRAWWSAHYQRANISEQIFCFIPRLAWRARSAPLPIFQSKQEQIANSPTVGLAPQRTEQSDEHFLCDFISERPRRISRLRLCEAEQPRRSEDAFLTCVCVAVNKWQVARVAREKIHLLLCTTAVRLR